MTTEKISENGFSHNSKFRYEDVLPLLGSFGKYQRRTYFMLCLPIILCGLHMFVGVFLLANPDHRCKLPDEQYNQSFDISKEVWRENYPIDPLTGDFSKCSFYKNSSEAHCDSWIYDNSKFKENVVTDWNLVCEKSYLRATASSILLLGDLVGSVVFGHLSDTIGRKPVFFMCLIIQLLFGVLGGLSPEYITFSISRMLVGAASNGVFLASYVISFEMVGPKYRLFAGQVFMMFFSCGYMLTAAFGYFIDYWRYLQIAISLPGVLFLTYWWIISESARWLFVQNRQNDAMDVLKKAAKVNQVEIPKEILDKLIEPEIGEKVDVKNVKKVSILDIFRHPNLRNRALLIFLNFFVNSVTYYGLSFNTNTLGDNHFVNFVASGAVEIPAYAFVILTVNRFGRKLILVLSMVFAGSVLILTCLIPVDQELILVTLAMLGKMAITASYGTIFIFATEQFPTVLRNIGLGASIMSARIGGITAPYVILLSDIWTPLPMIIFGVLTLIGGLLASFLPETLHRELPETIDDGNFEKDCDK